MLVRRAGHPGQTLGPGPLGDQDKLIELAARHVAPAGYGEASDDTTLIECGTKDVRVGFAERIADVCDLELVTKVGFICPVSKQRFLHVKPRKRCRDVYAEDVLPHPDPQAFDES